MSTGRWRYLSVLFAAIMAATTSCAGGAGTRVVVSRLDAPPDLALLPGIAVLKLSDLDADRLRPVDGLSPAAREVLDGTAADVDGRVEWLVVPSQGADRVLVGVSASTHSIVAAAQVSPSSASPTRSRSVVLKDGLHRTTDTRLDWDHVRFGSARSFGGHIRVRGHLQLCAGDITLRAAAWRSSDSVSVLIQQRACEEGTGSAEPMDIDLIGLEPGTAVADASRERVG